MCCSIPITFIKEQSETFQKVYFSQCKKEIKFKIRNGLKHRYFSEPQPEYSKAPNKPEFSDETIQGLVELGEILKRIRRRLIDEGYTVEPGRIYKAEKKNDILNT